GNGDAGSAGGDEVDFEQRIADQKAQDVEVLMSNIDTLERVVKSLQFRLDLANTKEDGHHKSISDIKFLCF
ncbi:hypothetical protein CYMTET_30141, partial [Cymbomonas tetramitiformis]